MHRVLLISYVNWDSLIEIPAILNKGGCEVDIFCTRGSWVMKNKQWVGWEPASTDNDIFIEELFAYLERSGHLFDWIIPGDDAIVRVLNERITSPEMFSKIMPLTKIENRDLLGSKAGFSELCSKYDIKTPGYLIYNPAHTVAQIGAQVGYPMLVKLDKSEGGYGVFMCDNEQSLAETLEKVKEKDNLVFQQFIKGYDVNTEVLYRNGELLVYSYSRTLTVMGKFGVSTQRLYYQNDEVKETLVSMGRSLGLNGFGNVVFMYSEQEQKHYLIEIDMRPNAWMYYGKFMGNDFPEGVKRFLANDLRLVTPTEKQAKQQLKISLYKKDVYRCILEKDMKGLMAWLTNRDGCWRYIPFYDLNLLFACTSFLFKTFRVFTANKIKRALGGK